MQITKEALEKELAQLRVTRDQLVANANVAIGAISHAEAMLKTLEQPEPPEPEPKSAAEIRTMDRMERLKAGKPTQRVAHGPTGE